MKQFILDKLQKVKDWWFLNVTPYTDKLYIWFTKHLLKIIGITITTLVLFYVYWFFSTKCNSEVLNVHELRFYIALLLIIMCITGFAGLRLYNAVVINTGVVSKLMKSVNNLDKDINDSLRETKQDSQHNRNNFTQTMSKFERSTDALNNSISNLDSSVKKNTSSLNK